MFNPYQKVPPELETWMRYMGQRMQGTIPEYVQIIDKHGGLTAHQLFVIQTLRKDWITICSMVNAPYTVWIERVKELLHEQGTDWEDIVEEDYDFYVAWAEFDATPEQAVDEYNRRP